MWPWEQASGTGTTDDRRAHLPHHRRQPNGAVSRGVSAENRAAAGVAAGDEVEVEVEVAIELDTAPREVVVPEDLAAALAAAPTAQRFFETLSFSQKQYVLGIKEAKTAETRQRRVVKAIAA